MPGAIAARANAAFGKIRSAQVLAFGPPAVFELGNAEGFDFELKDQGNLGHEALLAARNQMLELARKDPRLALVRPNGLEDAPQVKLDVDQNKAGALGSRSATSTTRCRAPLAAPMSTTSWTAAASRRSMCRPMAITAPRPMTWASSMCAAPGGS
jgi:hypothetical protein